MNEAERKRYERRRFLAVQGVLRRLDPLKLLAKGEDLLDDSLYVYETTLLLRTVGAKPDAEELAGYLLAQGRAGYKVDRTKAGAAARDIEEALKIIFRESA